MTTFGMRGFLRSGASSGTSREAGARDSCALRGVAGLMTGRRGRVLCCSASCNSRASFSSAALLSCSAALASSSSFINSSMSARSASLGSCAYETRRGSTLSHPRAAPPSASFRTRGDRGRARRVELPREARRHRSRRGVIVFLSPTREDPGMQAGLRQFARRVGHARRGARSEFRLRLRELLPEAFATVENDLRPSRHMHPLWARGAFAGVVCDVRLETRFAVPAPRRWTSVSSRRRNPFLQYGGETRKMSHAVQGAKITGLSCDVERSSLQIAPMLMPRS